MRRIALSANTVFRKNGEKSLAHLNAPLRSTKNFPRIPRNPILSAMGTMAAQFSALDGNPCASPFYDASNGRSCGTFLPASVNILCPERSPRPLFANNSARE